MELWPFALRKINWYFFIRIKIGPSHFQRASQNFQVGLVDSYFWFLNKIWILKLAPFPDEWNNSDKMTIRKRHPTKQRFHVIRFLWMGTHMGLKNTFSLSIRWRTLPDRKKIFARKSDKYFIRACNRISKSPKQKDDRAQQIGIHL